MWRSRIFWRLFATYGVFWLLMIGLLGMFILSRMERLFVEQIEDRLRSRAVLLREMVHGRSAAEVEDLQPRIRALEGEIGTRITLIDQGGTVLADSEVDPRAHSLENHADRPEVIAARTQDYGISQQRYSSTVNREMMYVAVRTDDPRGAVAFVRVALPLDDIQLQLSSLRHLVWTAVAGTALAGLALAFWLSRRMTLPLGELTRAARRIASGAYGHKVHDAAWDEIGILARTFNHMSERLASQFTQLEEDREQLRAILGGMVEGVVALDAEERILFANERAAQLLEFHNPRAVGRKLWQVVRRPALQEVVRKVLADPETPEQELSWDAPTARSFTVHAARLPGAPPRGAVLVLHDTSELRRLERVRQEFVANVSHELKTPLSIIKACIETLIDGAVNDPAHRGSFLEKIAEQSDRLHALILDLLSLARIESGTEVFEFQAVALEPVVENCLDRHRARAQAKEQTLEAVGPDHASVAAWGDDEAIGQILDNLVDNAVKYTPAGGRIRVRWGAENGQVQLEVADNGIGIPEHDLPRIFERFYRVDKARSRELGGTGLGLSIVKHLAQAMRGSIQATSRLGEGTSFLIHLPQAADA
jgi:two-component system phosphate regulon sensor histidine kinase PhoR